LTQTNNKHFNKKNWIKPSCGTCLMKIAYELAIRSTKDNLKQIEIIKESLKILSDISQDSFTTELSSKIIEKVEELTGIKDPYKKEKKESNEIILSLEPYMVKLIASISDPFEKFYKTLLLTIFGNVIDFATGNYEFELSVENLKEQMNDILKSKPTIDDSRKFYDLIKNGDKNILYIVDNAGEIVCDKLLIENLSNYNNKINVVVRSGPLVNDATIEDALSINLSKIKNVKIIQANRFCLGFLYNNLTSEFKFALEESDIIISKGQNNFETIIKYQDNLKNKIIVLILKLKCKPLADFVGVKKGDFIIKILY